MNHEELTPLRRDGYHGSMPTDTGEQQRGQATAEKGPGDAKGGEGDQEPQGILEVTQEIAERAKQQEKLTSNALKQTAETIGGTKDALKVLQEAEFVAAAAAALSYNADLDKQNKSAQEVLKKLEGDGGLKGKIDAIQRLISAAKLGRQGEDGRQEQDPIALNAVLNQASEIARLAKQLSEYYEEAKISNEYDDPFKQIVSFEELMTKFNITNTDPEFKPDGQFPLLKITKYYDKFGREMIEEEAHPENFLRWVQKKIEFYHDFDPMASIDLFQGMYIVAGSRKVSMYEILVDFDAYFAHRVRKSGELKVQEPDLERARIKGDFVFLPDADDPRLSPEEQERLKERYRQEG